MTTLDEAKARLEQLQIERAELEHDLDQAINDPDPDPSRIISLKKQLDESRIYSYVQKSRVIRIQKQLHIDERQKGLTEKEQLEAKYSDATRQVELAQRRLQDVWEEQQRIGVQLFALTQKIETDRQAINETQQVLLDRTINWKTQSLADQLSGDSVCDY